MGIIGLILGLLIGTAAKLFKVKKDSRIDLVLELLPGANCGGCGKAGCADFAKAVVSGELPPGKCPATPQENIAVITQLLGIENSAEFRKTAVVLCGGDINQTINAIRYNGISKMAVWAIFKDKATGKTFAVISTSAPLPGRMV